MSSKPAKSHSPAPAWSISARLVFLFTLAATALLLVATVTIYFALVRHMDEVDTDFLREKLRSLRDDLVEDGLQRDMLQHVVGASRNATEPFTYHVRILTDSGESLAETPGMSNLLPRERFGIPAHSGEANPPVAELRSTDGRPFLALAAGVESDAASENRWIVQLAQDRSKDRAFLRDFRALLIVLLVLGAGAAAGLGLFVARRGLRPLDKMTASVARIEASHLHERIGSDDWPKELSALAGAFDEMLRHLEDAFARLSQFSADLAHELRTPVCNLRGEAEVALSRPRSPEEYRDVLGSSIEELERLSQMIESLLFLARAENPKTRIKKKPLDGAREIATVIEFHQAAAQEQGVAIELRGMATVPADVQLFHRAISNLLANALQHTRANGKIVVELTGDVGAAAEVRVRDTGAGIAAEHLPRLFDRFYRADPARHAGGTGLGLALVKSIMELHRGSVDIESEPGKGTVVILRFPITS